MAQKPPRDDMPDIMEGFMNPYHPVDNPDGVMVLLVAENKLTFPMLAAKIEKCRPLESWVPYYGDSRGNERFRKALARMLEITFVQAPVDPEALCAQAGVMATVDSLAWCLGEAGDACIVPGPVYPAFPYDFYARARIHLHVAQTDHPDYELTEARAPPCARAPARARAAPPCAAGARDSPAPRL
jgi:aspartate/methionine/tyrosine aminotransferase